MSWGDVLLPGISDAQMQAAQGQQGNTLYGAFAWPVKPREAYQVRRWREWQEFGFSRGELSLPEEP